MCLCDLHTTCTMCEFLDFHNVRVYFCLKLCAIRPVDLPGFGLTCLGLGTKDVMSYSVEF